MRDVHERIDVIHGVKRLAALGDDRLDAVQYTLGASARTLSADLLLLHQGFMPSVNLSMSLGCRHVWDPLQHCFRPHVDRWGATDRRAVFIAGDGAGIVGAFAAEEQGRLAALAAAHALGRIDAARRDELARLPRRALKHALRGRRFIDALYRPAAQFRMPDRDTVVCRCEEVTAVQIIDAVRGGCTGPNQAKAFLRCGMGPCQGRLCGTTVTELVARETCSSPAKVGHFRMRFPVKPVTLGELAALAKASAEASTAGE